MMGTHTPQKELFTYSVDLDRGGACGSPAARVQAMVDFTFAREAVAQTYGQNGNESVDPAVLVKLMFLLLRENVRRERELMRRLPERLDWLWFLGYRLDDEVPNHSVLSKARTRWGGDLIEELFVRSVQQCVEAGVVDGTKVHVDGSLIDADASRDSVFKADADINAHIRAAYGAHERKLDEMKPISARCETNLKLVSMTDPDAPCISSAPQSGTACPRYKHHRMVDDRCGVITAVATTDGDVAEASQVEPLCQQHEVNTGTDVTALVGDRGYGTDGTCCALIAQGVRPHMAPMQPAGHKSEGLFTKDDVRYDETADVYVCPVGHHLKPRRFHERREMTDYFADKKVCAPCALRAECTKSETGRSVARHWREAELEVALTFARLPDAQADRRRRRYLMEGTFAHSANRYRFKRALAATAAAANPGLAHRVGAEHRAAVRRDRQRGRRGATKTAAPSDGGGRSAGSARHTQVKSPALVRDGVVGRKSRRPCRVIKPLRGKKCRAKISLWATGPAEVAAGRRESFEPELGLRRSANGLIEGKLQPLSQETNDAMARMRRSVENARKWSDKISFGADRTIGDLALPASSGASRGPNYHRSSLPKIQ